MRIEIGNQTVKITVSIGVTSYSHEMRGIGKTQIIEAADKALYNSKQTGRNRVSVIRLTQAA